MSVRVRFAPSPTGPLHIGGVRTALFNYLFAKKHGGQFILRIEDTDQNRFGPGAENYISDSLNWLNIPNDEGPITGGLYGPYRQSERKELYKKHIDVLLKNGTAYYAFDTPEQLNAHREEHEKKGKTFIYNWHNRLKLENSLSLSKAEVEKKLELKQPYVIRFKSPQDETIICNDIIRGTVTIDSNILDDKILFKSDGMPTYHLANIVDDYLMKITHVIRGEEWLPSLALHVLLYRAFNWKAPEFAHLPLILKPVGKGKLSKRDGDKLGFPVFPLSWEDPKTKEISRGYKDDGYLQEAVCNMLAFLGWNPGTDQELFTLEELVNAFELERVQKAGAKFDPEKTKWFQQQYFQKLAVATISKNYLKQLKDKGIHTTLAFAQEVVTLVKERAIFYEDLWTLSHYFFTAPENFDPKAAKKSWKENTPELISGLIKVISDVSDYNANTLSTTIKQWIADQEIGMGKVMQPFRLSLVGAMQGPDVFAIAATLGKDETIKRLNFAINNL